MKRLLSIAISLAILALIYFRIEPRNLLGALARADPLLLAIAISMAVPQTVVSAYRLCRMVRERVPLTLCESIRFSLAGSVLNMVLPSKMGDLSKAWFLKQRGHLSGAAAFSLVVTEKICDTLALLAWCAFGLLLLARSSTPYLLLWVAVLAGLAMGLLTLLSPRFSAWLFRLAGRVVGERIAGLRDAWSEMQAYLWGNRKLALFTAAISLLIWLLHLFQIWVFILALGPAVPFFESLALTSLSIFAGLLPLTFAGIGTRDAALIFFYRDYFDPAVGAALGLLCTLRYVLPAIAGLPLLSGMSRPATNELERLREAD